MLYSKKELYQYKEFIKLLKKDVSTDFSKLIVVRSLEIILEKMESIEVLIKQKRYNSVRTLIRPIFQSLANVSFILSDKTEVENKALAYNAWYIQNYSHKVDKIMDNFEPESKKEFEDYYVAGLEQYFSIQSIEKFRTLLNSQRDYFYKTNNKRYWYNILEVYDNEVTFIQKYLQEEIGIFYFIYSENIHGNDVILSLNRKEDTLNDNDYTSIFFIEYHFHKVIASFLHLIRINDSYQRYIDQLSEYRQKVNHKMEQQVRLKYKPKYPHF